MIQLNLKRNEERRLRTGHLWVFSNEINSVEGEYSPGGLAQVKSSSGQFLGTGYYNRSSLIACRILTRQKEYVDRNFLARRIDLAISQRKAWYPGETAYRLIYSEGDMLPGFVVDRMGDHLVIQTSTAGADALLEEVLSILVDRMKPAAVVLRNDSAIRNLEGLPPRIDVLHGKVDGPITIRCEGINHRVDLLAGQKTGFFFDQRENRLAAAPLCQGGDVLDCFSYTGSWALTALKAGATRVKAVDSSGPALELARESSELNGMSDRFETVQSDVSDYLDEAKARGDRHAVVLVDPPAFAPARKDLRRAVVAYEKINRKAMDILVPGGYLVSSSCSFHVPAEEFSRVLVRAAAPLGRTLRLVEWRGQSRDHPANLAMPETRYLKTAVVQCL